MKIARVASAPKMPQNNTRCWYIRGTRKYADQRRPDEHVVDAETFSMR